MFDSEMGCYGLVMIYADTGKTADLTATRSANQKRSLLQRLTFQMTKSEDVNVKRCTKEDGKHGLWFKSVLQG